MAIHFITLLDEEFYESAAPQVQFFREIIDFDFLQCMSHSKTRSILGISIFFAREIYSPFKMHNGLVVA